MASHKYIELNDGSLVKVDVEDYTYLNRWKWQNVSGYAMRLEYPKGLKGLSYRVLMHRVVVAAPDKIHVDHINGDRLDNTRSNLRLASPSQNQWNKGTQKNNTSGHKGIVWDKSNEKWRATINMKEKFIHVGRFSSIDEAVEARNTKIKELHGEFARAE